MDYVNFLIVYCEQNNEAILRQSTPSKAGKFTFLYETTMTYYCKDCERLNTVMTVNNRIL